MNNYCVLTTINNPTKAIEKLYEHFGKNLIIVGDRKTPLDWEYKGIKPLFRHFPPLYAPDNHYARKNIGYLKAIDNKADLIYDTDDDNIPNENWRVRKIDTEAQTPCDEGWFNVYKAFSDFYVWPRGFSLKNISKLSCLKIKSEVVSSIQQGLSDNEADVDAIWRMIFKRKITFRKNQSIILYKNTWCSFNSQSTWWFPKAYPLMYLPVTASFRCTDIWRSFIAQRCLWEIGEGVTFHSPAEVFQDRNEHDLMKDFADEVPGYLNNDKIVDILGGVKLKQGERFVCENLLRCYRELVYMQILPFEELDSVKEWIKDYENITR